MKVHIEAKNITLSSNNDKNYIKNEAIDEIVNQLSQELIFGGNTSYLVSGYRGAGKTTFINSLVRKLEKHNVHFVRLNFSKYEEVSIVLRKLIRELYLTLQDTKMIDKIKDNDLVNQIKLLYDHTFFEISTYSSLMQVKERSSELTATSKISDILKKILPVIAVLLSGLNLKIGLLESFNKHIDIIILLASLLWFTFANTEIKYILSKRNSTSEERIRKSLYDDEIAEYHLRNSLSGLEKQGIKIVFVFDEIDKIDNNNDVINLISDLKPLILSNLASFIIVSGQKLYYKLLSSKFDDDSIIGSIFTRSIHVPLVNDFELQTLFESYLKNESVLENENVKNYLNSVILDSNRTLRRFINLIQQDVVWDENEAYISVAENDNTLITDTRILNIVNSIIENYIDNTVYEEGIKDFLSYQLFIWVKKMKLKGSMQFFVTDIFSFSDDLSSDYPVWYEIELNELCIQLINKLVDENLLASVENEGVDESQYRWSSQASIDSSAIGNDIANTKIIYLEEMINIEKYSREIISNLGLGVDGNSVGLKRMISILVNNGIVSSKWIEPQNERIFDLSNKVRHGNKFSVEEVEELMKAKNHINSLRNEMFLGFTWMILINLISDEGYSVLTTDAVNRIDFDIIAKNDVKSDIAFEVFSRTYLGSKDISMFRRYIDKLNNYNQVTNKVNKLVLVIYSRNNRNGINSDYLFRKYSEMINSSDDSIRNSVFVVNIQEDKFFDRNEIINQMNDLNIF